MIQHKAILQLVCLVCLVGLLSGCSKPATQASVPPVQPIPTLGSTTQPNATQPAEPQATAPQITDPQPNNAKPTAELVDIPDGWNSNVDPTGQCQVATPPDWQMGTDFFLAAEKAEPSPIEGIQGSFPLSNAALWGVQNISDLPEGHRFQQRTSMVIGEIVCSVWRIKAGTNFTADETAQMDLVGSTLQEVQK